MLNDGVLIGKADSVQFISEEFINYPRIIHWNIVRTNDEGESCCKRSYFSLNGSGELYLFNCSSLAFERRAENRAGREHRRLPVHPSAIRKDHLFFRHHCQMFTQVLLRSLQWWSLPEGNVFRCFQIIFCNVQTKIFWLHTVLIISNSKYLGEGEQGILFLTEVTFYVFEDLLSRFIVGN